MSFTPKFYPPESQEIPRHPDVPSTSADNVKINKDEDAKITKSTADRASVTHGFTIEKDENAKWD